jgi:hypothetical protein
MPPLNRQNWGQYLTLLKDNGAGREVTDHLHNIKDNYRNPLMHPEDTSVRLWGQQHGAEYPASVRIVQQIEGRIGVIGPSLRLIGFGRPRSALPQRIPALQAEVSSNALSPRLLWKPPLGALCSSLNSWSAEDALDQFTQIAADLRRK